MQGSRLNNWVQLVASVGVLIGLLLVYIEIRQNNELVSAELRATRIVSWEDLSRFEVESGIRELFVRSIESPDELTTAEILKLDSYFTNIVTLLQQDAAMRQAGLANYERSGLAGAANFYFGGRFARAWFRENRGWIQQTTPEVADGIGSAIEATPVQEKFDYLDRLREAL